MSSFSTIARAYRLASAPAVATSMGWSVGTPCTRCARPMGGFLRIKLEDRQFGLHLENERPVPGGDG